MILKCIENVYAIFKGSMNSVIVYLHIDNDLLKMLIVYIGLIALSSIMSILLYTIISMLDNICSWVFMVVEIRIFSLESCSTLAYTYPQLVERKLKADINLILRKCCALCSTGVDVYMFFKYGLPNKTWNKVCFFSIESLINFPRNLISEFFRINKIRFLFICYSIYYVYGEQIVEYLSSIRKVIANINTVVNIFPFIVIIYGGVYFFGDFRYKNNGINEVKKERYIQLIDFEEKLLAIYEEIYQLLDINIEELIQSKENIIFEMIYDCYELDCKWEDCDLQINDMNLTFNQSFQLRNKNFNNFKEMSEIINEYKDLKDRFLKSKLNYANLFYVDKTAFINNGFVEWEFRYECCDLSEERTLCKERMIEWYNKK